MGVITCLVVLFGSREYAPGSLELRLGAGVGLAIAVLTFALTVKPIMKNKVRFAVAVVGTVCAIVSTMLYCRTPAQILAATFLYFAAGYTLVIR